MLPPLAPLQASTAVLDQVFLGNALTRWIVATAIFLVVFVALRLLKGFVISRIKKWAAKTETQLDDLAIQLVEKTKGFFLVLVAAFAATHSLVFSSRTHDIFETVIKLGVLLQFGIWAGHVVSFALTRLLNQRGTSDSSRKALANVFGFLSRLVLWSLLLLLALANLGVDVTAAVAGLGVGGIAIALALQNVLSDLFASLTIILDKPFEIGDAIVIGDFSGTVEEIGLKTTRLRSVSGEQIIVANSDMLGSRIRNYKRMQERRLVFSLGVTYQTPPERLEAIPQLLSEIVTRDGACTFDRAYFKSFGDFALIFEVVCSVNSPELADANAAQHRINLAIAKRFAAEKIDFAYPTQTLFVKMGSDLT